MAKGKIKILLPFDTLLTKRQITYVVSHYKTSKCKNPISKKSFASESEARQYYNNSNKTNLIIERSIK